MGGSCAALATKMWAKRAVGLLLALLSAYIHAEDLPADPSAHMLDSQDKPQDMPEQLANPPEPVVPKKWGLPKPYEVEIPEEKKQKRRGPRSAYLAGNPLQRHRDPTKEELFKQVGLDPETGHASVVRAHAGLKFPSPSLVPTQHANADQTLRFAALLVQPAGLQRVLYVACRRHDAAGPFPCPVGGTPL
jgi:hypothetical protein